ncbi:MAG: OadG family protein [bacterium]|nr:OadG family protein [bacterium]
MYSEALITGQGVTLSEALSEGLKVTGVGLAIVFGVLVILMCVLCLFKVIFYKDPSKQAKPAAAAPVPAAPAPAAKAEEDVNEDELIAVLTAAVAASLNTSTYNLQIKSYRRIDSKRPAWNKAGVRETIGSRF